MICDVCEAEEVAFIVGDANTGAQQFMGAGCFARFGLEFAGAVLGPDELRAAADALTPPPTQTPPSEAPDGTGRPKRKTATAEPTPPEGPASGPAAEPPAASDGGD